jgi:predicted nucleic acid-binding protein
MIVVDTNLIGHLFLSSERSAQAEQALQCDPHWAAPLLWRSELRNVLATQIRLGRLAPEDAQTIITQAEQLLQGNEYTVASGAVLRLAAASGCAACDCEFIALAHDLGARLVTVDRQLIASFPQTAIALENYIAYWTLAKIG